MTRVLVADAFEPSGLAGLKAAGCDVIHRPEPKDEAGRVAQIRESQPDILVVRSTPVTAAMLDAAGIKLVVRAGAGYNTIDVAAASRRGVYVSNCPGKNSIAVAELAFALILALDRRIPDNVANLRQGRWNKTEFSQARGLFGRTLGLIGMGRIGREMIPRARAFGMPVIAWSRSFTREDAERLEVGHRKRPTDVAKDADVVSVHLALAPETRGLLGTEFFQAMRDGACFINTSRGEIVDQPALIRAMHERRIRAGLDVYAGEPSSGKGEFADPILREPDFYGTHHIGASTVQAQEAIAEEAVRIIRTFIETGRAPNVVNLARRTPATHRLIVRHRDRPGVLASILDAIKAANINVQEMDNIVFEGAEAAIAHINLDAAPPRESLQQLQAVSPDILELKLLPLAK